MRNVISEDDVDPGNAAAAAASVDDPNAAQIRESLDGQYVCPFCGVVSESPEGLCARCAMENTSAARKATKTRIGPWYVYQHRNPAAPGMKWETLLSFVQKGKIKPRTIVRGPTTHQLWRFAAHVKGLSREFGVCYSCGGGIDPSANLCPHCNRLQEPPINPDVLLESDSPPARPASTPGAVIVEPERVAASVAPAGPPESSAPPRSAASFRGREPRPSDSVDEDAPPAARPAARPAPAGQVRRKQTGEDYLSPRELAAAFNLDFSPKNEPRQRAAVATQPERGPRKPKGRPRRIGRKLFLAFLLIGAGVVAYGAVTRPDLRVQAQQWGVEHWAKVKPILVQKLNALKSGDSGAGHAAKGLPKNVRDAHALPAPPHGDDDSVDVSISPPDQATKPVAHEGSGAREGQAAVGAASRDVRAAAKSADGTNAAMGKAAPNSSDRVASQSPATAPSAAQAHVPTETPAPPAPEMDLATAAERARTLYNKGIDAEQRVDFTAAVKCYEQIMKLPRETWPTDLELRLKLAKAQASGK